MSGLLEGPIEIANDVEMWLTKRVLVNDLLGHVFRREISGFVIICLFTVLSWKVILFMFRTLFLTSLKSQIDTLLQTIAL